MSQSRFFSEDAELKFHGGKSKDIAGLKNGEREHLEHFIRYLRKGCMFANTGGRSLCQWISNRLHRFLKKQGREMGY